MASVWYIGNADTRIIDSAEWTRVGHAGATNKWDKTNGWSVSQSVLSAGQIAFLDDIDEFVVTGSNGPRPGAIAVVATNANVTPSDLAEATDKFTRAFAYPAGTDASVRAAALALSPANGGPGGTVVLPNASITLLSPLPLYEGVWYKGVEPVLEPSDGTSGAYMADMEFSFSSGTVLLGDGTFPCFTDGQTDQGSVPAGAGALGATQLSSVSVTGVGLSNFTDGIRAGAANVMGLVWGRLDKIYIRQCSGWGVRLVNFAHVDVGEIRTCLCQKGQYYASQIPSATFIPGNSNFRDLYHLTPQDGRDRRLCRGIVFEGASANAALNEIFAERVQVNGFNRALLSDTVTFTNGTANATVADGTKYAVGMPVVFTTTNFGFTLGRAYVVSSVSGNTLTFASTTGGAAISATGSGTLTAQSYGFPNVELGAQASGAKVVNSQFLQVDVEGNSTVGLWLQNTNATEIHVFDVPQTSLVSIVGRNVGSLLIDSRNAATSDFDGNGYYWRGIRGAIIQRPGMGQWYDNVLQVGVVAVHQGAAAGKSDGDLQGRSSFVYPATALGEKISPRDSAVSLTGLLAGDVVFAGSSPVTFTLPTITADTTPSTSIVGCWFDIINVGTATVTVSTNGTQLFNKVAAKTSITVGAQTSTKIIAAKDNGGNLFWVAKNNGALS